MVNGHFAWLVKLAPPQVSIPLGAIAGMLITGGVMLAEFRAVQKQASDTTLVLTGLVPVIEALRKEVGLAQAQGESASRSLAALVAVTEELRREQAASRAMLIERRQVNDERNNDTRRRLETLERQVFGRQR